jgi:hypothetical protein
MKSLDDLYKKREDAAAPSATPSAAPSVQKAPSSSEATAPISENPPGLPQEYIDINLKEQPLPEVADMAAVEQMKDRPLNARRLLSGESMCHVTNIPYRPGTEPEIVQDRIDQGPRVFANRAEKEKFERDPHEEKADETKVPKKPTVAHPDTLKPGTFITGESRVYRPG